MKAELTPIVEAKAQQAYVLQSPGEILRVLEQCEHQGLVHHLAHASLPEQR